MPNRTLTVCVAAGFILFLAGLAFAGRHTREVDYRHYRGRGHARYDRGHRRGRTSVVISSVPRYKVRRRRVVYRVPAVTTYAGPGYTYAPYYRYSVYPYPAVVYAPAYPRRVFYGPPRPVSFRGSYLHYHSGGSFGLSINLGW
jgi:hypothetical protein